MKYIRLSCVSLPYLMLDLKSLSVNLLLVVSLSKVSPLSVLTRPSKSATRLALPSKGVCMVLFPVNLVATLLR